MTQHTAEPWRILPGTQRSQILDAKGNLIAFLSPDEMERGARIVACVNLLAGIPTKVLLDAAKHPDIAGRLDYLHMLFRHAFEWSGSPDPEDPDNFWIDDETGERVNAHTGERTKPA